MNILKAVPVALVVVGALFSTGCQSARKALNLDTSAVIHFEAAELINPDSDGRASPVVIHVFKLADSRNFARQDFLSLYEGASARLGKDLLGSVELKEVTPGEKRTELIELTPEVKYLGLMAEFIQYQNAVALAEVVVLEHNENGYFVQIEGSEIKVIDAPEQQEDSPAMRHMKHLNRISTN